MRLFVALDLPWELRQRVAMLSGAGIPGARWVPPENYHVTLRFIGETPRLHGGGYRPRAGCAEGPRLHADAWRGWARSEKLDAANRYGLAWNAISSSTTCKTRSRRRCNGAVLEPERRRFQPHLTLARLDAPRRRRSRRSCRRITCFARNRCRSSTSRYSARCWARTSRFIRRRWNTSCWLRQRPRAARLHLQVEHDGTGHRTSVTPRPLPRSSSVSRNLSSVAIILDRAPDSADASAHSPIRQ